MLLLIPFFLVRFGLLALLDKGALRRAAHFAPLLKQEQPAYWFYQISNLAIFVCMLFLNIRTTPRALLYTGLAVLAAGLVLLVLSVVHFANPPENGFCRKGLYRLSRNPMYVAYFVYFIGCVLLTQSLLLLAFVLVFQISSHWIIRSEERWCVERFGEEYRGYMRSVRRYL